LNKKYIHFKLIWHINMICFQEKEIMIGTTSSRILYQLRDKYTICRCCWNVATHKMESSQWENWNNLFCGKFLFLILYIYMCLWLIVLNDIYDLIPVTSWPPFIFVSFVSFEGWGVMGEGNWRTQRKPSIHPLEEQF
jgi:hypothetical protein